MSIWLRVDNVVLDVFPALSIGFPRCPISSFLPDLSLSLALPESRKDATSRTEGVAISARHRDHRRGAKERDAFDKRLSAHRQIFQHKPSSFRPCAAQRCQRVSLFLSSQAIVKLSLKRDKTHNSGNHSPSSNLPSSVSQSHQITQTGVRGFSCWRQRTLSGEAQARFDNSVHLQRGDLNSVRHVSGPPPKLATLSRRNPRQWSLEPPLTTLANQSHCSWRHISIALLYTNSDTKEARSNTEQYRDLYGDFITSGSVLRSERMGAMVDMVGYGESSHFKSRIRNSKGRPETTRLRKYQYDVCEPLLRRISRCRALRPVEEHQAWFAVRTRHGGKSCIGSGLSSMQGTCAVLEQGSPLLRRRPLLSVPLLFGISLVWIAAAMARRVYRDHNVHNGLGDFNVNNVEGDLIQNNSFATTDSDPHLGRLYDAVADVGASHTSEQQHARGTCLEGTREEALGDIHHWSSDESSPPICWLSGAAGVGKSAIAMTVAEACEEEDGLVASFFFFRSDPKRNRPNALALTIALGLVENIPSLRAFIDQKISERPTILKANLELQFQELVVQPSLQIDRSGVEGKSVQKVPDLVIIDGLDECGDEDTQLRILSIIQSSYQQSPASRPALKFLICSRPEAWIQEAFGTEELCQLTHYVVLDDASRDIEQYLRHEFQIIRTSPKYSRIPFPSPWPSEWELRQLVWKASGQFVYVATAVVFVKTPYLNPVDQLRTILTYGPGNQSSNSPFPKLDQLYHIILSVNPNREKLLSILAPILLLPYYVTPTPEFIEILLDLTPGELELTLRPLHSILSIRGSGDMIGVLHTSFRDYIFDQSRSGIFFLDEAAQKTLLAQRWLQALSGDRLRRYSFTQLFEGTHKLLFTEWVPFCIRCQPTRELLVDLQNVDLGALFMCNKGKTWNEIFGRLVPWLQKRNACDLDPNIVERFENGPKHFHAESSIDLHASEEDRVRFHVLEHAVILAVNRCRHWDSEAFEDISNAPLRFTFTVKVCRCNSDVGLASFCPHAKRYEAACLRALKTLVSNTLSRDSDGSSNSNLSPAPYDVYENLITSSLLHHCVFGSELLAQCRTLFSLGRPVGWPGASLTPGIEKHRKKWLDWLETCPEQYAAEAKDLKLQLWSFFGPLALQKMSARERDRLYHNVLSACPDQERLLSILAAIFVAGSHLPPSPDFIGILLDLAPGEIGLALRPLHSVLSIQGSGDVVRANHISFRDYLFDYSRSGIFFIDRPTQAHSLARRWLQALSAERLRRYSFHPLFGPELVPLFTHWIPFCVELVRPGKDFLVDLQNVEISAVLLAHKEIAGDRVFGSLVSWLQESNAYDLEPNIIERFKYRPKHFHLNRPYASDDDRAPFRILETTAVLKINGHENWDSREFRDTMEDLRSRSNKPRFTDCRCEGLDSADHTSSPCPHRLYQDVCLQVVRDVVLHAPSHNPPILAHKIKALIGSSLLQHCAFQGRLLIQFRKLCLLQGPWSSYMSTVEREECREKLLDWLETHQQQCEYMAEGLKSLVKSVFQPEPDSLRLSSLSPPPRFRPRSRPRLRREPASPQPSPVS
ncbi:hypothetical protein PM082_015867 [Marasmius tenuissimus]|nr:hypothetical protein PM082_015867 [Marasmius tenuissimus]